MILEQLPYNTDASGCCSCLRAAYSHFGAANFIGHSKDGFKGTCVFELVGGGISSDAMIDQNEYKMNNCGDSSDKAGVDICCIGYTRDSSGKVQSRHIQHVSNTIHSGTGGGGNTDCFVFIEKGKMKMSRHQMTELKPRPDGITNTLTGVQKDHLLPLPNEDDMNDAEPKIIQKFGDRGTNQYSVCDMAHTIPSNPMSDRGQMLAEQKSRFRIRKLTPRECFRLMGVPDANVDLIQQAGISNCQQYKMAGNSIVVDCLEHIFDKLFVHKDNDDAQMSLF